MLPKNELSTLTKLKLKKYRDKEDFFIVEGKRLIDEGINSLHKCLKVIVTNQFENNQREFINRIESKKVPIIKITNRDFHKISNTKNPQGIAALFLKEKVKDENKNYDRIIAFENISDPGNLGTMLRTCDWFGFNKILLSNGCADIYNPKVLRASMGAIFHLNIDVNTDLIENFKSLKENGYQVFYADMNGEDYRKVNFNDPCVVCFCNEASGPTKELEEISHNPITIPRVGKIDSLNVSAATAIILSRMD